MLMAIRGPVARLKEMSRPGRFHINTACQCFNSAAMERGSVGSAVIRLERASGSERTKTTHSQSTTYRQSASRLSVMISPRSLSQALTGLISLTRSIKTNRGSTWTVRRTQMGVEPTSLSSTGSISRGGVVAARVVSILMDISTFTGCQRILRYIVFQLARDTVPATTSPVAVNVLETNFVAGRPIRLTNC